jgi:diphthamide synthase (EF-2-diphthine--ammonia ligase)
VIARVTLVEGQPILGRAKYRDRQGPAHTDRRLADDDLLSGAVMTCEDDDRLETVAGHLPTKLLQPWPQEPREDVVLGIHDEGVRFIHAPTPP